MAMLFVISSLKSRRSHVPENINGPEDVKKLNARGSQGACAGDSRQLAGHGVKHGGRALVQTLASSRAFASYRVQLAR